MLRILISTDNHLGVWEKDEVRGDDSFNTMDEVMCIAKREVGLCGEYPDVIGH